MRTNAFMAGLIVVGAVAAACSAAGQPAAMEDADVVILGEVHDNPDAHLGQAALISRLQPTAVVFEMLTAEAATATADVDRSDATAMEAATDWRESGWPPFAMYAPIFEALGSAQIVGAAVPRDRAREAFSEGALTVFDGDGVRFGLDQPLPANEQEAREALQFAAHCDAVPMEMMPGFVEAQRLRDATFAQSVLDTLEVHGPPVVLITGNGHARTDWGVPAKIAQAAPTVTTYAVAFVESDTDMPFDEVNIVPPAQRPDPCAQFRSE